MVEVNFVLIKQKNCVSDHAYNVTLEKRIPQITGLQHGIKPKELKRN